MRTDHWLTRTQDVAAEFSCTCTTYRPTTHRSRIGSNFYAPQHLTRVSPTFVHGAQTLRESQRLGLVRFSSIEVAEMCVMSTGRVGVARI